MDFKYYIRKPFAVEALEITEENMAEVAKLVGEVRTKDNVTFIALDRRLVPNVTRAFKGWYVTRMGDQFRCFSPRVFKEQFDTFAKTVAYEFTDDDEEEAVAEAAPPQVEQEQTATLPVGSFKVDTGPIVPDLARLASDSDVV